MIDGHVTTTDEIESLFKKPALKKKRQDPADAVDTYRNVRLKKTQGEGDEEVEEGRFYGDGLSSEQKQILDYIDNREDGEELVVDGAWLKRAVSKLHKSISKNAQMRAKYEMTPEKFAASESELDANIKNLVKLTENSALFPDFCQLGCASSVVGLIGHENTDISADAIDILNEITDDDTQATEEQSSTLFQSLVESQAPSMLISNLLRLDETVERERRSVYNSLSVIENLNSINKNLAQELVESRDLLQWLFARIQIGDTESQNTAFAIELISILLTSSQNVPAFLEQNAIEILLQLIAPFRMKNPKRGEEEEFVENCFDVLAILLDNVDGKDQFLFSEGVELCLLMLKGPSLANTRALNLLSHLVGSSFGGAGSKRLVDAGGLRFIFSLLMQKNSPQVDEYLLSIFSSLLRTLSAESSERNRVLAKFIEKDNAKLIRVVEMRQRYRLFMERRNGHDVEDQIFEEQLDAGIFAKDMTTLIIAWLYAELEDCQPIIRQELAKHDQSLDDLKTDLRESLPSADSDDGEVKDFASMIQALLDVLNESTMDVKS